MAKLLEHQGKDLLRQAGIATPAGCLVYDLEEARAYMEHRAEESGEPFDPASVTEELVVWQIKGLGAQIDG